MRHPADEALDLEAIDGVPGKPRQFAVVTSAGVGRVVAISGTHDTETMAEWWEYDNAIKGAGITEESLERTASKRQAILHDYGAPRGHDGSGWRRPNAEARL